jgi:hypothetical protein
MNNMAVEMTPARLGKTVVIRGEVKGSEDLIIDGHVEGAISLAENRLTIGPNADVLADLSARDVLIQGRLKGNIVATAGWSCAREVRWKGMCGRFGWPSKTMRCFAAR